MKLQVVFEAFSDPQRRRILDLLKKSDELSVKEISEHFELTGATLSHHLNKLKSADLVISKRRGQQIFYRVHTSVLEDFASFISEFLSPGGSNE